MAESNFSKVDEYGFERHEDFDFDSYEQFMSVYLRVLATRAQKWASLLGDGKSVKRTNTVKRYVRKGIPSEHRPAVWMAISEAEKMKDLSPDLFHKILDRPFEKELVDLVKTDLPRTFPDNIYFTKEANHQTHLFNILIAYAHNNRVVGYCQGLNYIAGLLLLSTKSEEISFWLLKVLVEKILPDYYTKTMDGLIVDIEVLSELVKSKVPDVHQHVINLGLPWAVITTKWFVCLFAEVLPIETVLRIWDCLFYEGSKILFRVCLTLIKSNRAAIMACNDFTSLAECFKAIVKNASALHCHEFMQAIFKVPGSLSNTTITKLRARFAAQRRDQLRKEQRQVKVQPTCKSVHIKLQWIPSHVQIKENEDVDLLAKEAVEDGVPFAVLPLYTDRLKIINKKYIMDWQEYFDLRSREKGIWFRSIQPQVNHCPWIDHILLGRNKLKTALRLRSGLIPSNMFSFLMKKVPSPLCNDCGVVEDVLHILMECARNHSARTIFFCNKSLEIGLVNSILASPMSDEAEMLYILADLALAAAR